MERSFVSAADRPAITRVSWAERVDMPVAVKGASTGFTVLILGSLLQPVAASWIPVVGSYWLPLVAVAAFAIASRRIGAATLPTVHGALAALISYLLALPLVLLASTIDAEQIGLTALTAVVVGGLVGFLRGWARRRRPDAGAAERGAARQGALRR